MQVAVCCERATLARMSISSSSDDMSGVLLHLLCFHHISNDLAAVLNWRPPEGTNKKRIWSRLRAAGYD